MGLNLIQIPGTAVRIEANAFRKVAGDRPGVQRLISEHLYALLRQILFGAACNRIHTMEERCARWMLMTHDRAGEDTFPLTQEFLAQMLGARRSSVSPVANALQQDGLIRYIRGRIDILDLEGLQRMSCECYGTVKAQYDRLLNHSSAK